MTQCKISELSGALLDVAVALAEGRKVEQHPSARGWWKVLDPVQREWHTIMEAPDTVDPTVWSPSTKWEHGGPIIHRERILLWPDYCHPHGATDQWRAQCFGAWGRADAVPAPAPLEQGVKPLIAAMRAYVASKFGETVELP